MKLKIYNIKLILFSLVISIIPSQTMAGGSAIASLNGAACNFNTITEAIQAAQSGDVVYIKSGTHFETIGEISIDLTLIASFGVTGCERDAVDLFVTTVDGQGQTFDSTGGLVKVTNGARVAFRNMALRNSSAVNGGVMAVIQGSTVTLDNTDVHSGSALSAGGNIYVTSDLTNQSSLVLNNGSSIYDGTVITGDGGGIALYQAKFLVSEGSIGVNGLPANTASNNGGGIYAESSSLLITHSDSSIENNQSENSGGGIYVVDSTVDIADATITENITQISGGGIYLDNTMLTLANTRVSLNSTTEFLVNQGGGGLYVNESSSALINSSVILSNDSETLGGGILSVGNAASVNIVGSDILNNSARAGGGVFTNSPLVVDLSRISFNSVSGSGGGISCILCQNLSIINSSQISNNTAFTSGGGLDIFSSQGTHVEILNSSIIGNSLTSTLSNGGGIAQDGGTLLIDSCSISSNSARDNGGGVFLFSLDSVADSVRIINSQFFNNSVPSSDFGNGGGALYLHDLSNAHISGSEFNANTSGLDGGALFLIDSSLVIDDSIVSDNSAIFEGGGIYAEDSDLMIRNSSIIQNETYQLPIVSPREFGGGGIKALNSNLDLINSKVNHNISNDIGGGIFYDGSIDNSLTIKSVYGILSDECLPSALGFNEYCSEVSNNEAIFGAGLMIRGSAIEQGINLSGVALNANQTQAMGPSTVSGVAIELDMTNPLETEVTMENLILVENDGYLDPNRPIIFIGGNIKLNLLSTTIANNIAIPIRSGVNNSSIIVQNSIVHQNELGPLIGSTIPFISLCNNSQSAIAGSQNFGPNLGDPRFTHTNRGEYRLLETSPSLDSCTFGSINDIDGNVRPNGASNYDQGAFEMNSDFVVVEIFMDSFE